MPFRSSLNNQSLWAGSAWSLAVRSLQSKPERHTWALLIAFKTLPRHYFPDKNKQKKNPAVIVFISWRTELKDRNPVEASVTRSFPVFFLRWTAEANHFVLMSLFWWFFFPPHALYYGIPLFVKILDGGVWQECFHRGINLFDQLVRPCVVHRAWMTTISYRKSSELFYLHLPPSLKCVVSGGASRGPQQNEE